MVSEESRVMRAFGTLVAFFGELKACGWSEWDREWTLTKATVCSIFANRVVKGFLGWGTKRGEGHYDYKRGGTLIVCYDRSMLPVVVFRLVTPRRELTPKDEERLEEYVEENPTVRFAVLTNCRRLVLFRRLGRELDRWAKWTSRSWPARASETSGPRGGKFS